MLEDAKACRSERLEDLLLQTASTDLVHVKKTDQVVQMPDGSRRISRATVETENIARKSLTAKVITEAIRRRSAEVKVAEKASGPIDFNNMSNAELAKLSPRIEVIVINGTDQIVPEDIPPK